MAITVSDNHGSASCLELRAITLDSSYPEGGYATSFPILVPLGGATGHTMIVDPATGALRVYVRTTGVEVGTGVDLSAVSFLALTR
jgi:hypothetical protein